MMLYVNTFRDEPAIIHFEWTFTPNPQSSQNSATVTGSAFPVLIPCSLLRIRSVDFGCNACNFNELNRNLI